MGRPLADGRGARPLAHAPGSTSEVRHPVRASGPATLAMLAGRLARSLPAVGRGPRDDGRRTGRVGHPTLEIAREQAATIGQTRVPARLGPTIANLNTTDLSVEVQDIQAIWATAPPGAGGPPRAEPLRPQDTPEAVPLPPGARLCRVGEGFGGADADGTVVVLWRRVPAPRASRIATTGAGHTRRDWSRHGSLSTRRSASKANPTAGASWSPGGPGRPLVRLGDARPR
jgi:hypothetical protein